MNIKEINDMLDCCFLFVNHDYAIKGMMAYGYSKESSEMGIKLASYLIKKKPLIKIEIDY